MKHNRIPTRKELEESLEMLTKENSLLMSANADARRIATERNRYEDALRIIAGEKQCPDNLMGNVDIARAALLSSNK